MADFDTSSVEHALPVRGTGGAAGPRGRAARLALRPVRVETGCADEEGRLVFAGGRLVAVLVRLTDQHGTSAGRWFFEHGFGGLDGRGHPTFPDLDAARDWIARGLGRRG